MPRSPAFRIIAGGLAGLAAIALSATLLGLARPDVPPQVSRAVHKIETRFTSDSSTTLDRPPPAQVGFKVDTAHVLRSISPLIYGIAAGDRTRLSATGATLNRWGGNAVTRYNWKLGTASNAARDWNFANAGGPAAAPSRDADGMVTLDRDMRVESLITIPAMGWVARDGDNATRSTNVPSEGGPPAAAGSDASIGYDPSANRERTSVPSFAREPASGKDPAAVYQDQWVRHLVQRFGTAADGGVAYYVIDNEPDLWSSTHTDVHPVQMSYDDMLSTFVQYAEAIKDVDPAAQVLGPAVSGWTGYFYSARDRGTDNFRTHADRLAHGDMPFLPWWLNQVRQHDASVGRRSLDVLDVHYYPQAPGVFAGRTEAWTNALRLRSTRALWDPSYTDESWIDEPVDLIPRLRAWIDQYYPGTRLGINEWNWGADTTVNGALAIADVLGIFGREGVDTAAYWTSPPLDSPGAAAFRLYTNFDGMGDTFGDLSVADSSSAPDDATSYASINSDTGDLTVIAINKRPDASIPATFSVGSGFADVIAYRYDGSGPIALLGTDDASSGSVNVSLAPASITLLWAHRAAST